MKKKCNKCGKEIDENEQPNLMIGILKVLIIEVRDSRAWVVIVTTILVTLIGIFMALKILGKM